MHKLNEWESYQREWVASMEQVLKNFNSNIRRMLMRLPAKRSYAFKREGASCQKKWIVSKRSQWEMPVEEPREAWVVGRSPSNSGKLLRKGLQELSIVPLYHIQVLFSTGCNRTQQFTKHLIPVLENLSSFCLSLAKIFFCNHQLETLVRSSKTYAVKHLIFKFLSSFFYSTSIS